MNDDRPHVPSPFLRPYRKNLTNNDNISKICYAKKLVKLIQNFSILIFLYRFHKSAGWIDLFTKIPVSRSL